MIIRKIFIIGCIIILSNLLKAQYSSNFENPKTPTVYQMEKYGNQQINLYTGKPNININLIDIQYGQIKLPIVASYSSNGIRADEEASSIGLGWYIDSYLITQNINGNDDLVQKIIRPRYYYSYKPAEIVKSQPIYWYDKLPQSSSSYDKERLNISNSMIANPLDHMGDYFMAKLKDDGEGFFDVVSATFFPITQIGDVRYPDINFFKFNFDDKYKYNDLYDIEIDLFKINLNGTQIIFFKNPDGDSFTILNNKGYKIEINKNGTTSEDLQSSWIVTDPIGTKYYFEKQLKTFGENFVNNNSNLAQSDFVNNELISLKTPTYDNNTSLYKKLNSREWKITKIKDKNNNEVNFYYNDLPVLHRNLHDLRAKCDFIKYSGYVLNKYYGERSYILTKFKPVYLDGLQTPIYDKDQNTCYVNTLNHQDIEDAILHKIVYNDNSIVYNYSYRNDIPNRMKIDSIIQFNKLNKINEIVFNAEYFPSSSVLGNRLRLNNIIINDRKYSFSYIDKAGITSHTDYWGYYNGLTNSTPFINPFRLLNENEIPTWALPIHENLKGIENRSAHPENIKIGLLNKIIYPTGGSTDIEYELNTFDNIFFPNYDNKINKSLTSYYINHLNIDASFKNRSTPIINAEEGERFTGTINLTNGISGTCNIFNASFKVVVIPDNYISQYNSGDIGKENFWYLVDNGYVSTKVIINQTSFNSMTPINYSFIVDSDSKIVARVKFDPSCPTTGSPIGSISATINSIKYVDYKQNFSQGFGVRVKKTIDKINDEIQIIKEYSYYGGKHIPAFNPIDVNTPYSMNRYDYGGYNSYMIGNYSYLIGNYSGYKITSNSTTQFQTDWLSNGDFVGYDSVEVKSLDSNNINLGKTIYYFSNVPDFAPSSKFGLLDGSTTKEEVNLFGNNIRANSLSNGSLIKKEIYDRDNNLKQKTKYSFSSEIVYSHSFPFNVKLRNSGVEGYLLPFRVNELAYQKFTNRNLFFFPLKGYINNIINEENYDYDNGNSILRTKDYKYNKNNLQILEIENFPDGTYKSTSIGYATEFNISQLINSNIIGIPIYKSKNDNQRNESYLTKYENLNDVNPTSVVRENQIIKGSLSSVDTVAKYTAYDMKGNLLEIKNIANIPTTIIYGYSQTLPIAKIEGATYAQIMQAFNLSTTDSSSYLGLEIVKKSDLDINQTTEDALITELDAFRKLPILSNFQITTYTYNPLIGVTSITPPSGIREIYKYDTANRLQSVVDVNGNILKEYKYNYKSPYYNVIKTQTFTRNNCGSDFIGGNYTYTVPAGKYSSMISQADADSQAQDEINLNGQSTANNSVGCFTRTSCSISFNTSAGINGGGSVLVGSNYKLTFGFSSGSNSTNLPWTTTGVKIATINGNCRPTADYTSNDGQVYYTIKTNGDVILKTSTVLPNNTSYNYEIYFPIN